MNHNVELFMFLGQTKVPRKCPYHYSLSFKYYVNLLCAHLKKVVGFFLFGIIHDGDKNVHMLEEEAVWLSER